MRNARRTDRNAARLATVDAFGEDIWKKRSGIFKAHWPRAKVGCNNPQRKSVNLNARLMASFVLKYRNSDGRTLFGRLFSCQGLGFKLGCFGFNLFDDVFDHAVIVHLVAL